MAWTAPSASPYTNLEVVTHTKLTTYVADNLTYLKDIQDGAQQQDFVWQKSSADAVGKGLTARKSRGSIAAPAAASANDVILNEAHQAYNNGGWRNAVLIQSIVQAVGATFVQGMYDLYTYRASDGVAEHGLRVFGGTLRVGDGSLSTPGLAYINDVDTGFARINPNDMVWTVGGLGAIWAREAAGATQVAFHGLTPQNKQTITGSRGGNAALASLLTALNFIGLISDTTT